MTSRLKIAVIAGEESGDLLGRVWQVRQQGLLPPHVWVLV